MSNNHVWAAEILHSTRSSSRKQWLSVNVIAGMIHHHLIGPYLLSDCLDKQKYLIFLQQKLPDLLQRVIANVRGVMWFQYVGAQDHISRNVRNYLDTADLSCLDFFFSGDSWKVSCTRRKASSRHQTSSPELALQLQTFVICQKYSKVFMIQCIANVKLI